MIKPLEDEVKDDFLLADKIMQDFGYDHVTLTSAILVSISINKLIQSLLQPTTPQGASKS